MSYLAQGSPAWGTNFPANNRHGAWIPGSPLEKYFSLDRDSTILALAVYGFIAAVLPVWLLLGPRDYLSSFLKIGTIALLIGGVIVANPPLHAPPLNEVFLNGGPTFEGDIFPFVFICVMCGAVSGFHSLVASGTTPRKAEAALLQEFADNRKLNFPLLVLTPDDWQKTVEAYKLKSVPTMVLLGRDGNVREVRVGGDADNLKGIETAIKRVVKEKK